MPRRIRLPDQMPPLTLETLTSIRAHCEAAKAQPDFTDHFRKLAALGKRHAAALLFQPSVADLMQDFWRSHELARRGVPPSLHWIRPVSYPGHQLVQVDADLSWLCTHHKHRIRPDSPWAELLFGSTSANRLDWSDRTHALVRDFVADWVQMPSLYEENWRLTNTVRGQLALTSSALTPSQIPSGIVLAWRDALALHAANHKDRRGRYSPAVAAARRTVMMTIHMKAGRNISNTAKYWNIIMRENITRQAVEKHLQAARDALAGAGWGEDWLSKPESPKSP